MFAPPMSIASVAGVRVRRSHRSQGRHGGSRRARRARTLSPGRSVIAATRSSLARAFRSELGSTSCTSPTSTRSPAQASNDADASRALAREARVMVDAGVSEPERARALLELGAHRVVVGTETLTGPDALDRLLAEFPRLVLSVDLRDGRMLSPDPQLAGLPALDAVARLHRPGLREVIVLDLARVGSGAGPDVGLIAEIHAAFPDLELLAGGGVRDVDGPARARATPARPARSSRPRCTAASSARELASFADDRLHVRDERRRHVGAGRLLQPAPAGDPVELEHVLASVGRAAGRRPRSRRPAPRRPPGTGAPARRSTPSAARWRRARGSPATPSRPARSPRAPARRRRTRAGRGRRAAASPAGSTRRARAPARGRRGTRRRRRPRASSRRPSSRTAA